MAYKVKREKLDIEDLEIENTDGSVVVYTPKISLDTIAREYQEITKRITNISSQDLADEVKYQELGMLITQLISVVFDKEQAKDMIKTFEGNYIQMSEALAPYLTEVIMPKIIEIKNERIDKYKKLANETL